MQSIGNHQDSLGGPILVITNSPSTTSQFDRYQSRRRIDISSQAISVLGSLRSTAFEPLTAKILWQPLYLAVDSDSGQMIYKSMRGQVIVCLEIGANSVDIQI